APSSMTHIGSRSRRLLLRRCHRLPLAPPIEQLVHGPNPSLGRVLASGAGRLTPFDVVHLATRPVRGNQVLMNAFERDRSIATAFLRVAGQPCEDVGVRSAALGIQGHARAWRPDFPLTRSASTWTPAAMLTDRDYTEDVDHCRAESRGWSDLPRVQFRRNYGGAGNYFPPAGNLFSLNRICGAEKRRGRRAPRPFARDNFEGYPPWSLGLVESLRGGRGVRQSRRHSVGHRPAPASARASL